MFNFIFPSKNNTIASVSIDETLHSSSNSGRSEILELYVLTSSLSNQGKSRVLVHFDLSAHSASIASGLIPSSSVEYHLKLKNANHYETLPSSFDLVVHPLSQSWDEGRGLSMFDEDLIDNGYSNWNKATSLISWDLTGSDFYSTLSASQHFDVGDEDLSINISNIVYAWLTGSTPNNGLVLKYLNAHETGTDDLYVKKFFSRHSHVPERIPRLEARWESAIQDDRANINYNVSGVLYYYRNINGQFQSLPTTVFCNILNSSSTVVQTLTASLRDTGVYEASGVLVSFTSSTRIFRDVWFNGTTQYFTGTFTPTYATGSQFVDYSSLDCNIINLKSVYASNEKAFLKVFIRNKDYQPAVVSTGSLKPSPVVAKQAYISIENAETEEVILPYSTGSVQYSKLSYNAEGNSFKIYMDSFTKESLYKIKILLNYNNEEIVFDKNWVFKVKT